MNWSLVFIFIICGILITAAIFIFIRTLIKASKGKCCESCKACHYNNQCSASDKKQQDKKNDKN
ncbi:MAG: hypothetical protein RR549_06970 [Oscillospiraceae bacterium]